MHKRHLKTVQNYRYGKQKRSRHYNKEKNLLGVITRQFSPLNNLMIVQVLWKENRQQPGVTRDWKRNSGFLFQNNLYTRSHFVSLPLFSSVHLGNILQERAKSHLLPEIHIMGCMCVKMSIRHIWTCSFLQSTSSVWEKDRFCFTRQITRVNLWLDLAYKSVIFFLFNSYIQILCSCDQNHN